MQENNENRVYKYLGIDYGTKRIGVSISDENKKFAFPLTTIQNRESEKAKEIACYEIRKICDENFIELVVVGYSKNYKNEDNEIMKDVFEFKQFLEDEFGIETTFEPEIMSTMQASRFQGEHEKIDASAAAIILQSYLDRMNH